MQYLVSKARVCLRWVYECTVICIILLCTYMCTFKQYMYMYSNLTTLASDIVMTVQFEFAYCKGHAHIVPMTV